MDGLDDEELNTCRTQIADAVEKASKLKDGKGRKTTSASRGKKGRRTRMRMRMSIAVTSFHSTRGEADGCTVHL